MVVAPEIKGKILMAEMKLKNNDFVNSICYT